MKLNWDDLRFFLAVCRHHTFISAASELKVTHTTVARRVSLLESSLQTQLFLRTEKGCSLTPAAELLLPYAEQLENTVLNMSEEVAGRDDSVSGPVRIGAPDGIGTYFLAACLGTLQAAHPSLAVELIPIPMYYSLSKREIDILITVQKPTHGKIVARKLTRYRLGLFSTSQYLNQRTVITRKKQLREHRFVGYIDDLLFDQDLDLMGELLPGLTADFRCSTVVAQLSAVASGAGIGIIPFFMAAREHCLIQVLPDHYIEKAYWLQVNPDSRQLARVRTTIDFIAEQIALSQEQFLSLPPGC